MGGLLIDNLNRISLSRFQLTVWTTLILGTLVASAIGNILAGAKSPLSIAVPQQIWLVLGISTTSLVGSPLLQAPKADRPPNGAQLELMASQIPNATVLPDYTGLLVSKSSPADASWADLFKGNEVGNFTYLDLAKVQMFFFTLVLVAAYGVAVAHMLLAGGTISSLPDFDPSMTALLAISHGGYLVNKAVPHSSAPS